MTRSLTQEGIGIMEEFNFTELSGNLSYEDIRLRFHTAKFVRRSDSKDKKDGFYRVGVMTPIGDIERKDWNKIAEDLIKQQGDEELFLKLKHWYRDNCAWLKEEKEIHNYTLECFVAGIHNNPEWVDYIAFNTLHRPELIN